MVVCICMVGGRKLSGLLACGLVAWVDAGKLEIGCSFDSSIDTPVVRDTRNNGHDHEDGDDSLSIKEMKQNAQT